MTFEETLRLAVDGNDNPVATETKPSIDMLSRAVFRGVLDDARNVAIHRNMFNAMLEDGAFSELPDALPPPLPSGSDGSEFGFPQVASPFDQQPLGGEGRSGLPTPDFFANREDGIAQELGLVPNNPVREGPSVEELVRELVRRN